MNFYPASEQPIGSPAVHSTPLEDLYVTLMSFDKAGRSVALRVIITPAVSWIWVGGVIVMVGGFIAARNLRRKEYAA